jgi:hypothetical protein
VSRHERDDVSLLGGLLLVLVAGLYLLADLTAVSVDLRWAVPAVLIGGGLAGLAGSLRRPTADRELDPPPP